MIFNMTGSAGGSTGEPMSSIIVTAPAGSAVTASLGQIQKSAAEENGTWTFSGCGLGQWTVTAQKDGETARATVDIAQEGQLMRYYVTLGYGLLASDFDWGAYGTQDADYEILDGTDAKLDPSLWSTYKNWKARLLTSGTLIPLRGGSLDVFLVGGGGNNIAAYCGGGGGGYTRTEKNVKVSAETEYEVIIGGSAGITSALGFEAAAGGSAISGGGGSGGSGGGAYGGGEGGSDGSDGSYGAVTTGAYSYGRGQGTTTREFGEETGRLYAGGGGGGVYNQTPGAGGAGGGGNCNANGAANTGGGAGGTNYSGPVRRYGGSGVVVIRAAGGQTNG